MDGATLLLGVIAAATAVIAVVQVGMFVCGVLLSRRVNRLIEVVEQELRPVVDRVGTLSDDAARLSSLAMTRIERVDRAFERITSRLEETMKAARDAVVEPAPAGDVAGARPPRRTGCAAGREGSSPGRERRTSGRTAVARGRSARTLASQKATE